VQYDVALASRLDDNINKSSIYRADLDKIDFSYLPKLKRIATLHRETLYVIVRRTTGESAGKEGVEDSGTLHRLKGLKICLGPEQSGTRVVAEAVLEHHGIKKRDITYSYLMVPDMVDRLHTGDIDAGFLMSGLPSHAVQTLLNDPELRLLSLGAKERALIVESVAFNSATIPAKEYASQLPDELPIQTIATRAVLVTNEDLPYDVEVITAAIFGGAAFLGIEGSALNVTELSTATGEEPRDQLRRSLARELPSLPLHEDARAYYEDNGLRPIRVTRADRLYNRLYDLLTATWKGLTVLVILVAVYTGIIALRRDRTANAIGRRIIKKCFDEIGQPVDLKPFERPSRLWERLLSTVKEPPKERTLHKIRDIELRERVLRRWWERGDIDQARWRRLHELASDRISFLGERWGTDPENE
jgi:TRAP transporter TAXI family solute receptor